MANPPNRVSAADVEAAATRLAGAATVTPVELNARLSARSQAQVWLKREDLQTGRSYKIRGAYNLIAQLSQSERAAGVVSASAGNHAQGVAYACARLGVLGRIYVPSTTPRQKRDRIAALGGDMVDVIVAGETYDEASHEAARHAARTGATLVPAFDDPRTIAGQGTVVREAVIQLGFAPEFIVVPVGGGGLLAGTVAWLRDNCPATQLIGVEPAGAACLAAAAAAGRPVSLDTIDTFVDGAAVRRAGELTFPMISASGARLVSVPEGQVCVEMLDLYQTDGVIAEPAGALAAAAITDRSLFEPYKNPRILCVLSGGNNDVSRYAEVIERALIHQGRKHYFLIDFPQEPGALRRFLDDVLGPDDDITLFEYVKHNNRELGPALVGIELSDPGDLEKLAARMKSQPMNVEMIDPSSPLFRFLT